MAISRPLFVLKSLPCIFVSKIGSTVSTIHKFRVLFKFSGLSYFIPSSQLLFITTRLQNTGFVSTLLSVDNLMRDFKGSYGMYSNLLKLLSLTVPGRSIVAFCQYWLVVQAPESTSCHLLILGFGFSIAVWHDRAFRPILVVASKSWAGVPSACRLDCTI